MNREVALKIVLGVVGVLFLALAYPLLMFVRQDPALSMMFSLYVTLGVFLLLAIRNPSANRSLIAFTAWSSFARRPYGDSGNARHGCAWRTGGCGGARRHRRCLDRARASKAVRTGVTAQ
jgi:hypothetical protein